jgi:curved DNA-binding protein CbpA
MHANSRTLQLALKYHPDRTRNDPVASELFKNISAAYAVILDPNSRRQHDLALATSGSGNGSLLGESLGVCIPYTVMIQ